ncbi:MAG: N-formylglutamate amidohydrolase [Gammaproteobacteria bacterium]|nr:N-formylglutamate amidohydrolase [Gammaproteobacteria bacterium]NIN61343.1 N-formylglutamate amidohydrolase [Gammaproteobacteria bacterium]NIO61110.1 N-formylglutamate amidohydrolase [Gammaproteobacteria bacterium]NIP48956.1 N-formylglutamate amidohydrolase [Gammaproteobacteria bacterium]NIQ09410.1 N-formylglutamate amidohydrolase [Gammaproteobacteria bacterium]
MNPGKFIFSCEHGGFTIPPAYQYLFNNKRSILKSHRGWDAGALGLARLLSSSLKVPLVFSDISRLLIDLNRSIHHRNLFSEFTRPLDEQTKNTLIREHYLPYRQDLERWIRNQIKYGVCMLHFSVHSFAPAIKRKTRKTDIGLLYDPARKNEQELCIRLQKLFNNQLPGLMVRRNYPYRGVTDGFTTYLRTRFSENDYCGIEIEVNQKLVKNKKWRNIRQNILASFKELNNSCL